MALQLIYVTFATLLAWLVLRFRSDTTKEILVLCHQLAVLQRHATANHELDRPSRDRRRRGDYSQSAASG